MTWGKSIVATMLGVLFLVPPAQADEKTVYGEIKAEELKMTGPSADILDRPLAYPDGKPMVRAYRITVPPGKATTLHRHPVPLYAVILSGTLRVDYGTKGKRTFKPGDSFLEAVDWCHAGSAVGDEPVVLVSIHMGDDKTQNTVECQASSAP